MSAPRLLADEDLNGSIVTATRRLLPEADFITVVEAGLSGLPDPAVLEAAAQLGRLLVSHDVNTLRAAAEQRLDAGLPLPGVLLISQRVPVGIAARELMLVLTASRAEEWHNLILHLPL